MATIPTLPLLQLRKRRKNGKMALSSHLPVCRFAISLTYSSSMNICKEVLGTLGQLHNRLQINDFRGSCRYVFILMRQKSQVLSFLFVHPFPPLFLSARFCVFNNNQSLSESDYIICASITSLILYRPGFFPARNFAACTAPWPNTAFEKA